MSTKHTPGPWKLSASQTRGLHIGPVVLDSMADPIALVDYQTWGDSELSNANARLIAAAPDLLAALGEAVGFIELAERSQNYISVMTSLRDRLHYYRAAIAKAEG